MEEEGQPNMRADKIRPSYFRASLGELCREEDIMKAIGIELKFKDSDNPLLHIIKLLRNYQVHIGSIALASGKISIEYAGQVEAYQSFIVDNTNVADLRKLDSAKDYTDDQLRELLSIFETHQRRFGVVQLLYNTALYLGDNAVKVLGLRQSITR